jgi:ligand-binding sensor domain-containing protein
MPNTEYYDVHIDDEGNRWFASGLGLFLYNGSEFVEYTGDQKLGFSVFDLQEDSEGRIWCINLSGQILHTQGDELVTFLNVQDELKGVLPDLAVDDTHLYLFCLDRVLKIDKNAKSVTTLYDLNQEWEISNPLFYRDSLLAIVGTDLRNIYSNASMVSSEVFLTNNLNRSIPFQHDEKIYLWKLSATNELIRIDPSTGSVSTITLPQELRRIKVLNLSATNENIWLCTDNGFFDIEIADAEFRAREHLLEGIKVSDVAKDNQGLIWATTLDHGLVVIPNLHIRCFPNLNEDLTAIEKLSDSLVLFGTSEGVVGAYDIQRQQIVKKTQLAQGSVRDVLNTKNGQCVVVSNGGMLLLDVTTLKTVADMFISAGKNVDLINPNTIVYTSSGSDGIIRFEPNQEFEYNILQKPKRSYFAHYNSIDKSIWVGYVDKLLRYDSTFHPIEIKVDEESLNVNYITHTGDGITWVATFANGILGFRGSNLIHEFKPENGLRSSKISAIAPDDKSIQIATDERLWQYDYTRNTQRSISIFDGIPASGITDLEVYPKFSLLATGNGLFKIDQRAFERSLRLPEVKIESISVNDLRQLLKDSMSLAHFENKISFKLLSNALRANDHIEFHYRLGTKEPWSVLDVGNNELLFNSLRSGHYNLDLKAVDRLNQAQSPISHFYFTIEKAFWTTWWFLTLCLLVFTLLLFVGVKLILQKRSANKQKELEQAEQEKQMILLKLENLRSQMNPHFVFNALNSIQEYILINEKNLASDYLGKFADLMRKYLDQSNSEFITLEEEIAGLKMYLELEKLRFEDKLEYKVEVDERIDQEQFQLPAMLLQPFVENALKHGLLHKKDHRLLKIQFAKGDIGELKCIIEDNGIGRTKSRELNMKRRPNHISFATRANQDRLNLMNFERKEKISVKTVDLVNTLGEPEGTRVEIIIPKLEKEIL